MKIEFALTREDFDQARTLSLKLLEPKQQPKSDVILGVLFLVVGISVALILSTAAGQQFLLNLGLSKRLLVAFVLGGLAGWSACALYIHLRSKEVVRAFTAKFSDTSCLNHTFEFSKEGFSNRCACGEDRRLWGSIIAIQESDSLFLLRPKNLSIYIVPKRAFPQGGLEEFRALHPPTLAREGSRLEAVRQ